jgi:hypothetical protein
MTHARRRPRSLPVHPVALLVPLLAVGCFDPADAGGSGIETGTTAGTDAARGAFGAAG